MQATKNELKVPNGHSIKHNLCEFGLFFGGSDEKCQLVFIKYENYLNNLYAHKGKLALQRKESNTNDSGSNSAINY